MSTEFSINKSDFADVNSIELENELDSFKQITIQNPIKKSILKSTN